MSDTSRLLLRLLSVVGIAALTACGRSKVVYAVAGTDAVYRLTADLHLDERITIGTDANP